MLKKIEAFTPVGPPGRGAGGLLPGNSPDSQTPERSTLPSAVRGAGAIRLISPVAVRGAFGGANFGHCACRVDEPNTMAAATAKAAPVITRIIEDSSFAVRR